MKSDEQMVKDIKEFIDNDSELEKVDEKEMQVSEQRERSEEVVLDDSSDPIERMALQYGWKPEGKRSAEEYIKYALDQFPERGEALSKQAKKIEDKDSELSKMKVVLNELASHVKKQKQLEEQQSLEDLRYRKRQAIELGDVNLVEQLDQEQIRLNVPEPVKAFKERNIEWLEGTSFEALEMQAFARQRDNELAPRGMSPDEHMKVLEEHIRKKFPAYFNDGYEKEHINKSDAVDSLHNSNVVNASKPKRNFSIRDLTKEQQEVASYLEREGHMKTADYIKQLIDNGDLV